MFAKFCAYAIIRIVIKKKSKNKDKREKNEYIRRGQYGKQKYEK